MLDNNLDSHDINLLLSDYEYAYFCVDCGGIHLLKKRDYYNINFKNKSCPKCKSIDNFDVVSIDYIVKNYEIFLNFSFSFISNGREYGVFNTKFNFKFGGVMNFSLDFPCLSRTTKHFTDLKIPISLLYSDSFHFYYKAKTGLEYFVIKNSKSYPRANLYNCVCMFPYFDNNSNYTNKSLDIALLKDGEIYKVIRNAKDYTSIYKEANELTFHLLEFSNDHLKRQLRYKLYDISNMSEAVESIFLVENKRVINQEHYENNLISKECYYFYFSYEYSIRSNIIVQYCINNNIEISRIPNIFEDDPTINYIIKIDRKEKHKAFFIYYTLLKSGFSLFRIYNIPITDILFLRAKSKIDYKNVLSFETSKVEKCIYINDKLKSTLKLEDQGLLDYFIDSFGLYVVDKHYFNHINNIIDNISAPLYFGFDNSRSLYSDYMIALAQDFSFMDKQRFYESDNYKELKLYFNNKFNELRNKIKTKLKNEYELYSIVKFYYDDAIYQYELIKSPRLIVDIYIPSLKLVIEYQGAQHYQEVDYLPGNGVKKNRLKKQLERDSKLNEYITNNGMIILEWPYNIEVNPLTLKGIVNELIKV